MRGAAEPGVQRSRDQHSRPRSGADCIQVCSVTLPTLEPKQGKGPQLPRSRASWHTFRTAGYRSTNQQGKGDLVGSVHRCMHARRARSV